MNKQLRIIEKNKISQSVFSQIVSPAFEALTFLTVPFEKFCKIPTSYYFINKLTGEMQPEFIKAGLTI